MYDPDVVALWQYDMLLVAPCLCEEIERRRERVVVKGGERERVGRLCFAAVSPCCYLREHIVLEYNWRHVLCRVILAHRRRKVSI